ncbi:hypothetical protein ACLB2K_012944 [Fragaria x ananassa]
MIMNSKRKEPASGAGTTKRKELHGTTSIRALSGTWGEKLDGAVFYGYKFDFSCDIATELYSGLIFLIESELAEDVGNTELELYLKSSRVKASISSCGEVHLDGEQMANAKLFQEFFFNGLFAKLFHQTGKEREFLLKKETRSLWRQSYMYLVLPLEKLNQSWGINWSGINSCVSAVEFLKQNVLLGAQHCNGDTRKSLPSTSCSSGSGIFHLADFSVDEKNLKDMVVVAIHNGNVYSVFEVLSDTSAESPFESSRYSSYADYFHKRYGVVLKYPGQPLLRLKQSHSPHNLLLNFNGEVGLVNGKEHSMYAHMPPELLVYTGVRRDALKSFYLLPSLIHRLESLMLASQLREEISSGHPSSLQISSSLILEALTSIRCSEDFSMERLELLGDSVLKYAIGCHLFLKYPNKHEGELTSLRQSVICNANLHKLGIGRSLQGYIRDGAFDPRCWVGPGQLSLRPVPCECGVDSLEVPVDSKFQTSSEVVVGKCCDKRHRWMGSKTISDCVEALIGAYYVSGRLPAAVHFMKCLGIDVELEPTLVLEAIATASLHSYNARVDDEIGILESKLGYVFSTKSLLHKATTHASEQGYSYERLEFLGDCVLDLLITWHFYQTHKDIDPGELTDLRAASVNNGYFAQVAVRHNLQQHLQHCSGIAGAILIDTEVNLDEVWRVYRPLLSPIVTPEKLELPPLRELIELCGSLGYFYKEETEKKGETVHAKLSVQLKDDLLIGEGNERTKKAAKGEAAHCLLKELEKRDITYSGSAKKRKRNADLVDDSSPTKRKKTGTLPIENIDRKLSSLKNEDVTVIKAINMKKGGPRISLFELCKKLQWQMPSFKSTEKECSFVSNITLYIPNLGEIECTGDPMSDKKSSLDSAALAMLLDLRRQGKIIIGG